MQALGNQLRLKNRYGDGFQMVLSLKDADLVDLTHIEDFLKANIYENARVQFRHGKIVQYVLPVADLDISNCFNVMEAAKQQLGLSDWSLNMTTMEEVFVKVAREDVAPV